MSDPKTTIASYAANGSLIILGMTVNDFAMLAGIIFGAGTFVINWYYKHKYYKLTEQRSAAPFPTLQEDES